MWLSAFSHYLFIFLYFVLLGGRVIQWKFRCSSAGVIVLAMWRHVSTNVHQLVGRTSITITEDMANDEIIVREKNYYI